MEVTIERILPGGLGLAHADGKTVMVALAAPGDRLRVRVDRVKGGVVFASIAEVVSPSPDRVEPPCPYFGRCGGCDFQQLNYQAQLAAKVEIIKDCLRRIGGIENIPEFQITPAPNQWHYRARAQWQYDSIRKRLGYFESGSRRVCDVAECAVLVPELQSPLQELREQMRSGSLLDEARYFRAIVGDDGVSVGSPQDEMVPEITRTIHGETYRLNAESFFQTNADLLPLLIDAAIGGATGETAIELYCGVGLFTLPLARCFRNVIGVEDDSDAGDFARNNLASAGLTNAEIAKRDVGDWLEENLECAGNDGALDRVFGLGSLAFGSQSGDADEHEKSASQIPKAKDLRSKTKTVATFAHKCNVDFLLLDPPRTGAESRVVSGILKLRPKRICYVSCDPATLARDLKKLFAGGYTLDSLTAFDMFPQTHHVETVVHLGN